MRGAKGRKQGEETRGRRGECGGGWRREVVIEDGGFVPPPGCYEHQTLHFLHFGDFCFAPILMKMSLIT